MTLFVASPICERYYVSMVFFMRASEEESTRRTRRAARERKMWNGHGEVKETHLGFLCLRGHDEQLRCGVHDLDFADDCCSIGGDEKPAQMVDHKLIAA